jgi:hypothetical protein
MIAQHLAPTKALRPIDSSSARPNSRAVVVCKAITEKREPWRVVRDVGTAAILSVALLATQPAFALSQREQDIGGEFGRGTALQFGEADLKGKDFR